MVIGLVTTLSTVRKSDIGVTTTTRSQVAAKFVHAAVAPGPGKNHSVKVRTNQADF